MRVVVDIPNWLYNAIMEHTEPQYSQSGRTRFCLRFLANGNKEGD